MIAEFIVFLEDNSILGEFLHEYKIHNFDRPLYELFLGIPGAIYQKTPAMAYLRCAFYWSNTERGCAFWDIMNREWEKYILEKLE